MLKEISLNEEPHGIYPIKWVQAGILDNVPSPLVRVTTCGSLKIEVLYMADTQSSLGHYHTVSLERSRKGSSTGLTLLKMLASLPGHYASKDWLTEHLSSTRNYESDDEEEWGRGFVRVDNVVYLLRHLLCSQSISWHENVRKVLVSYVRNHRESGPGYQLAGEPLLWLDVDSIISSFKKAVSLEKQGKDACSYWEHVHALASKGSYLSDEPYSDWAKDKRLEIEGYLRHCVHRIHHFYLSSDRENREEQAIMLLRQYWQTHLTDEDILRPLMELLGKNARVQEALDCYQRLCERLAMEEEAPDPQTLEIAQNLHSHRGQEKDEALTPFSIVNTQPIIIRAVGNENRDEAKLTFMQKNASVENGKPFFLPDGLSQAPLWRRLSRTLEDHHASLPLLSAENDKVLPSISTAISEGIMTAAAHLGGGFDMDMPRRQLLQQIFGMATASIFLSPSSLQSTASNIEQFISQCDANISGCWQLMNGCNIVMVQSVLSTWLPSLDRLVKQPSKYQKKLAHLATEGYILAGLITILQQNYSEAEWCCVQAVNYSRLADDVNLYVAALKHLATKYLDANYPLKMLQTYQKALNSINDVSPLLRSRTYLGLALAYARCKQEKEAFDYLGLAQETFPEKPEDDSSFTFADCGITSLNHYGGLIYLEFNQPDKALHIFDEVNTLQLKGLASERTVIEIMNCQAEAALMQQDLELSSTLLAKGIEGAMKLHSKKRLQESQMIYQKMCHQWPHEAKVRALATLFPPEMN
ncbi:hypothetical protein KDW_30790 [Dictyobacter vulcani]|uniref:Bacterial transcriptional activator domain-containing protein n=1 Tax=Dictyobacter vulcani TaxID=2607529 RepID=A0A5J4KRD4_9CHLR|nr:BTAD domain-containing putative transcriptional regulator [Dictyobacter vulcani]GER88917.1 hypothetical protein KDW_30790 [Dictyobacter vulcani]